MNKELMQIITAGIMAVGFGLLFGVFGKKLIWIGLGSALTWLVYLGVFFISDENYGMASFAASVFGSYGAMQLAQMLKAPKTVFLFPLLVSLIPGSDLYRTMQAVLDGDKTRMATYGLRTLIIAFAIAFGIIVMLVFVQTQMRIKKHFENQK
jgi:uncharacterized membrane protein YjjB (DUF3815 family)